MTKHEKNKQTNKTGIRKEVIRFILKKGHCTGGNISIIFFSKKKKWKKKLSLSLLKIEEEKPETQSTILTTYGACNT